MTFGVVSNRKASLLHYLYYKNITDNGHYSSRGGGRHSQSADFVRLSCAETYIRFLCQRTVRISCNDDKFQFRIQVMRQLCQFDDFFGKRLLPPSREHGNIIDIVLTEALPADYSNRKWYRNTLTYIRIAFTTSERVL